MLCFIKLTGEHNTKKILLKIYVLWEYIFKTRLGWDEWIQNLSKQIRKGRLVLTLISMTIHHDKID